MENSIKTSLLIVFILISNQIFSQTASFKISPEPLNINNFVRIQSNAIDQANEKRGIVGGSLVSHPQNIASEESLLFNINQYSLTKGKDKSMGFSLRPIHKNLTNSYKFRKASANVIGYNLVMGTFLFIAPESFTNWGKDEKLRIESILNQYGESYSKPPVLDEDIWPVNYLGHPYQGSFYYNSLRSQDASFWHSSFFCLGNTLLWEYVWEGGFEQPSIQDLIVTSIAGILLGELIHKTTIKMSKNGFRWYEIIFVTGLNPAYAINNKFIFVKNNKNLPN